jgi:peptidoglycan hydrolase-like protein with peptidoglycan-binding domain
LPLGVEPPFLGRFVSDPASKSVSKKSAGDVSAAAAEPTPAEIGKFLSRQRLLKVGVSGKETQEQTLQLQKEMVRRGFLKDKQYEPGKYDEATVAAVTEFQRLYKLQIDGVVGQQTWSRLKFENAKQIPPPGIELLKGKGAPEGGAKAPKEKKWEGKGAPTDDGYSKHEKPKTVLKPPPVSEDGNMADKLIAMGVPAAVVAAAAPFLDAPTKKNEASSPAASKVAETTSGKTEPTPKRSEASVAPKQGAKAATDAQLEAAANQAKEMSEPRGHLSHAAQLGFGTAAGTIHVINPKERIEELKSLKKGAEDITKNGFNAIWDATKNWATRSPTSAAAPQTLLEKVRGSVGRAVSRSKGMLHSGMVTAENVANRLVNTPAGGKLVKGAAWLGAGLLVPGGTAVAATYAGGRILLGGMRIAAAGLGVVGAKFAYDDWKHAYEVYNEPNARPMKKVLAGMAGVASTVGIIPFYGLPGTAASWFLSRAEKAYG